MKPGLQKPRSNARILILAGLLTATMTAQVEAGPTSQAGPPIDVVATPSRTLPGGRVRLEGSAVPQGPGSQVTIHVQPPGAAQAIVLQAPLDGRGHFEVGFADTRALGTYQVKVSAPDGKTTAITTLWVVAAATIPAAVTATVESLLSESRDVLQAARGAVATLPPSSGRTEAESRLAAAEARVGEGMAQVPAVRQQMVGVFEARAEVEEDNPEWDTYLEELDTWERDADRRVERLRMLATELSAGTERCGTMDEIVEGLGFVSEATNYAHVPIDKSAGYWIDKVPAAFVARQEAWADYNPATKFLAISTMKTAANFLKEGPPGVILSIPGLVVDAAQLVAQEVFGSYCEKLEGPLSATFLGESFTKQGEPFFDYTTTLDGKLVLMYEKGAASGGSVAMTGYIEGNGRFEVRDNPAPIVRLTPGDVLFHHVISPPGTGYWDEVGQFSRALLPHSFRIPLKAVLAGDSIVFALQPAAHDFGEAIQGRSIYVVMPLGGLVPEIIDSPIRLQKAHSIIDRATRRRPILTVARGPGGTVVQGAFARDTTNATETARVRTQLTLKACDPGCLPLPFGPQPESDPPGAGLAMPSGLEAEVSTSAGLLRSAQGEAAGGGEPNFPPSPCNLTAQTARD